MAGATWVLLHVWLSALSMGIQNPRCVLHSFHGEVMTWTAVFQKQDKSFGTFLLHGSPDLKKARYEALEELGPGNFLVALIKGNVKDNVHFF